MKIWGRKQDVMDVFSLSDNFIDDLAHSGKIRYFRQGSARQSVTCYRMQDIADYMEENCMNNKSQTMT